MNKKGKFAQFLPEKIEKLKEDVKADQAHNTVSEDLDAAE